MAGLLQGKTLTVNDSNPLGTTAGNWVSNIDVVQSNGNTSHLEVIQVRDTAGSDWTSAGTRIQQRIDSTYMSFIEFNGKAGNYGMSFGTGGGTAGPTAATTKMTITTAGNVGIGRTSPGYSLDVLGQAQISTSTDWQLRLNGEGTTWAGMYFTDANGGDTLYFNGQNGTFAIGGGGSNVAGKKLHVNGGMSVGANAGSTANPTNGIYSEGNVAIGGTQIDGGTRISIATGGKSVPLTGAHGRLNYGDIHLEPTSGTSTYGNAITFGARDTTGVQAHIGTQSDGTFGTKMVFGTTQSYATGSQVRMSIDHLGNVIAVGDVTAYSDERLKSDIVTIPNALDTVSQLRGVNYIKDGKASTGVIAQEVEKVMPEVVLDGEYKSVAYGNMMGVMIEAIKELKAENEALKARLDTLEGK